MLLILSLSWMIIGQLPHKHSSRIVTPSVTPLHLPPSHFPWIFTTKDIYPPDFHHSTRYFSNCNNSASVYLTKTNCLNFKVWDHDPNSLFVKQYSLKHHCIKVSVFRVLLVRIFPHSDWMQMRENTNQKNSEYESFSHTAYKCFQHCKIFTPVLFQLFVFLINTKVLC